MKLKTLTVSFLLLSVFVVPPLSADDRFIGTSTELLSDESVFAYWTEERMKNAIPYPMFSPQRYYFEDIPLDVGTQADGEPGLNSGGSPGQKGSASSANTNLPNPQAGDSGLDLAGEPMSYTWPFPYTGFRVHNKMIKKNQYKTVGKVFFSSGGLDYVCSGASIGGRAVLTAGHCVSDGFGNWHSNWIFRPAYKNKKSIGKWKAKELWTFTNWHVYGSYCRDVGFAIVKKRNRKKLSQKVGYLGFAWNWDSAHLHWNIFGYPAEGEDFNGKRMMECQASFAEWTATWMDPAIDCQPGDPLPQCVGCDQTGGASGGPWILNFVPGKAGAMNYANSVNSTYYLSGRVPGALCGPYFDAAVKDFKDCVVAENCNE
jgi:hypothetical protein